MARINDIDAAYAKICREAGIPSKRDRMAVAGFRRVKTMEQLPDARRYQNATFASEAIYKKHIDKHLEEYAGISEAEYIEKAINLLRSAPPNDILRVVKSDGSVSKYCVFLNEFAAGTKEGKIRTAFKPVDGMKYWDKELGRNG